MNSFHVSTLPFVNFLISMCRYFYQKKLYQSDFNSLVSPSSQLSISTLNRKESDSNCQNFLDSLEEMKFLIKVL